mmetsp:Transcript_25090/g.80939  ORF Transcript_25090/g.80939 Transcript_25090/m.80939 type:complete len:296 (-) Transcript_25090:19-906(-)
MCRVLHKLTARVRGGLRIDHGVVQWDGQGGRRCATSHSEPSCDLAYQGAASKALQLRSSEHLGNVERVQISKSLSIVVRKARHGRIAVRVVTDEWVSNVVDVLQCHRLTQSRGLLQRIDQSRVRSGHGLPLGRLELRGMQCVVLGANTVAICAKQRVVRPIDAADGNRLHCVACQPRTAVVFARACAGRPQSELQRIRRLNRAVIARRADVHLLAGVVRIEQSKSVDVAGAKCNTNAMQLLHAQRSELAGGHVMPTTIVGVIRQVQDGRSISMPVNDGRMHDGGIGMGQNGRRGE